MVKNSISLSVEPVREIASKIPVFPNGCSMTSINSDVQSVKLTSEQLQDIEDEEILDKMVKNYFFLLNNFQALLIFIVEIIRSSY